ncbi:MAG: rhodanese-like domain-containing protein [bacterium]
MSHFQNINNEHGIVTAEQLKNILKSNETFTLVDVREKDEYQMNHIQGSVLIPLSDFENTCSVLSKNQPLILYCRSGRRSLLAQQHLQKKGYTNTFNLEGGILAYQAHEKKGANDEN